MSENITRDRMTKLKQIFRLPQDADKLDQALRDVSRAHREERLYGHKPIKTIDDEEKALKASGLTKREMNLVFRLTT